MPVHIDPTARLVITFFRDGQALKMALLLLAELDELQPGDLLRCWEA